ncbi:hypothetical protein T4D_10578 [Trichinella pseudospiralis]|uniref:Uncharacterized protein n=1 Tax=Trichinella pseudospiralis TaxID=6337 RepID=A0A0V1FB26_TRIPS|nr:hypothetical protein T4D_10578 [Trichinella pseudospiralis]
MNSNLAFGKKTTTTVASRVALQPFNKADEFLASNFPSAGNLPDNITCLITVELASTRHEKRLPVSRRLLYYDLINITYEYSQQFYVSTNMSKLASLCQKKPFTRNLYANHRPL